MKSEAYCKGENDYFYFGLNNSNNPYSRDSQDFEDYNAGMNQAYRKNPDLAGRLKQDGADERLLAFKEKQELKKEEEALNKKNEAAKRKKISDFKRMKDGY